MEVKLKKPPALFTKCKLTICKKVSIKDEKLLKMITGQIRFKISGFDPVVIEKDSPSQQDINDLFDSLKRHLEVQEAEDIVCVRDVEEELRKNSANVTLEEKETISSSVETLFIRTPVKYKQLTQQFTKCKLTICKKVSVKDEKLLKMITCQLRFKISGIDPVVIEKDSPSQQDINDLFDTLKRHFEVQEAEDIVFVSDVEEELRKNSANVKLEEKETISSSVETLFTKTQDKYKQLTQQVRENDSQDGLILFYDDYIDSLTSSFHQLQVAVGTEDQQQIKTPNTQKNVSCAENTSSRCESEQASNLKETHKFEASVYLVLKENNTDFSQKKTFCVEQETDCGLYWRITKCN